MHREAMGKLNDTPKVAKRCQNSQRVSEAVATFWGKRVATKNLKPLGN
jgi:hypothetical protein